MKVMTMTHLHTTEAHRILIVDDTSAFVESTVEQLHQTGFALFEYQTVTSAVEFESLLQQRVWDVVVCKYAHVPFETTDLLRAAQRLQPQTPVIVVGEQVTTREAFELGRLGVHEFIETSNTQRLIACVQQALSSGQTDSFTNGSAAGAEDSATQQLRLVLDSMQDAIMLVSLPDRRLIFVSSSYERVFGYPARVFLEDRNYYKQIMPPDEVEMGTTALQTLYRDGFVELDHRVIFPNGDMHWLHRRAWIIYDPQGKPIQLVDIARDITARKQAEEALRAVNRKQRAILDSLPDMMFHLRADGTILDYHFHASIADSVLPPEIFVGKKLSDFVNSPLVPSGTLRQAVDAMQTANALRQPVIFEYTMPDQHTYEARMLPIEDSDELIILSRDITELKQTEAKLRESEEKYRSLLESSDSVIAEFDYAGQVLYANDVAARGFGLTPQQMVGKAYGELFPPEVTAAQLANIRSVIDTGSGSVREAMTIIQGQEKWYRTSIQPVRDSLGNTFTAMVNATDITAIKQAETALQDTNRLLEQRIRGRTAELQEERNLLRTVIDAIPDSIYVKDRQHRMLLSNLAHFQSIGMADDTEIIGKTDLDLFPQSMAVQFHADEDRLFETGQAIVHLEEHGFRPDGSDAWMLTTKVPLRDVQGDLVGLVGVTRDITAIKAAGEALRESESRYRLLASNIKDMVAKMSPEGTLTYCSPSSFTLLGYLPEEMVGRNAFEFVYPDDASATLAILTKALAEKTSSLVITQRMLHKTGEILWVEIGTRIVLDENGVPLEITGVLRDITARKQAEEMLRNSEERYRATVTAMSEGLVVHGKDGTIQLCNSAAERILGLTADQMIGRTSVDPRWCAIHEDGSPFPGETHPAMVTLRTGEAQANVVMGVHKPDDTLTWILINSQSLIDPVDQQRYAVVATFADITAPKQAEAAIKKALADEKELGELKSRFVSMASHEFRNPLASILAATETLTMYWERMDKTKITDRLNRIHEQVDRMTAIMEDVLQLTRMQTGRSKFEPLTGDLDALCRRVVSDLAELPDYHDRIHYECSQHPLNAVFDMRLLQQALTNLLHNALKYSPPETSVRITLAQVGGQITLHITDEGIGIPAEDVKRLFEPFHRAANVGEISGTGLGLAIVKEAVELHGGSITVESQVNVGTTFTVTLPEHP